MNNQHDFSDHQPSAVNEASAAYRLQAGKAALLRPGYKQTEVGVIPDDWEVLSLREVCSKITDGTHDTPKPIRTGVPFLTAIHIKDDFIDFDNCLYLTKEVHQTIFARCNPQYGDVLMVNIGAGVAITALVEVNFEFSLKNVALLKPTSGRLLGNYLNQCLIKRKPAITKMLSSGGAQPFLSLTQIGEINVPVPPFPEQRAIAAALSDVDALLDGLERLIAKKRDLKQAAMQQLLTGQTRLPGFSNVGWISASASTGPRRILVDANSLIPPTSTTPIDWKVTRLGEVLSICHGKSQREVEVADGPYPILATGGQIGTARCPLYDKPSVLIGRKGTINQPQYMDTPFWTVDTLFYSAIKGENSAKFLYYRFCLIDWMQYNEASGVPSLNARTIENIEIGCPEPDEQTAIATILSDMDAELTALEARRDKTRALKQGMMQELLTGKTRLL
ncbi:restriction endonuclease subunit S [Methylomonas sp. TEB]|uniref:restriction endonuclease subunit S n=1 Tax=Methylomonas sp. TEB TaxID=3398229 RepID=UPI0039F61394